MKKQGETELLKGQSASTTKTNWDYHTTPLRDLMVHFMLCLYDATQALPVWLEPALILWNICTVATSQIAIGEVLMVGYQDQILLGYIFYLLLSVGVLALGAYVHSVECSNVRYMYLVPSFKSSTKRPHIILAWGIVIQTYLCTPRLAAIFITLLTSPSNTWPTITESPVYWAHLGATFCGFISSIIVAFIFLSYCKVPLPGKQDLLSSTSVMNELVFIMLPFYAHFVTSISNRFFNMRQLPPSVQIMIHNIKAGPSYTAIIANLLTVTFYNRFTRDLLTWVHISMVTVWALAVLLTDISAKWEKFLSLIMCLLGPFLINMFLRLGRSLDGRVATTSRICGVVRLAETCLLEAEGKLHPLDDRKAEYLKNFYFHQEKVHKLTKQTPPRLSDPEKLIMAAFESLLLKNRSKSFEVTLFYVHYLTRMDAGVLLPIKLLRKLFTDSQKRTLRHKLLYKIVSRQLQTKLESITFKQELCKAGKSDFSSLDCSPINKHLSLVAVPIGTLSQTNLDTFMLFERLSEQMNKQIKNLKEFYSLISKPDCDLSVLHKSVERLHACQASCGNILEILESSCIKTNNFHLLPCAMFAHHTWNNNKLMRELLRQYHLRRKASSHGRMAQPFLLVKESSSYFIASAEVVDLGSIKYSCGRTEALIGKGGSKIQNIFSWLPEALEPLHKHQVLKYLNTLEIPYLGVRFDRLLRLPSAHSHLYSEHHLVTFFAPSLVNGLQFAVAVEQATHATHFLVFDASLRLNGMSLSISEISTGFAESIYKRSAKDFSPHFPTLLVSQVPADEHPAIVTKQTGSSLSTNGTPSEICTLVASSNLLDGELFISLGNGIHVSCKAKDLNTKVLTMPDKGSSTKKTSHYVLTITNEVFLRLSRVAKKKQFGLKTFKVHDLVENHLKFKVADGPKSSSKFLDQPLTFSEPPLRTHLSIWSMAMVGIFISRLRNSRSFYRKYTPNSADHDAESGADDENPQLKSNLKNQKKDVDTDRLLAKLDNRFAKPNKDEMEAADSINTHRQIMYDTKSLTIQHISPKSIILWAMIGLMLILLLFWGGMVYCYWLEVTYMGGKAAILLDARLVQSLLVISRWTVWQMIDAVVEKVAYDKNILSPDRFVKMGLSNYRNWQAVYDEAVNLWYEGQDNYLLQVEKLPQSSIDTINLFMYKANITLGPAPKDYITKTFTLSNILYEATHQVHGLYKSRATLDFTKSIYAKAITIIEDGSPATVSKYADQIVVVEGNKFTETQQQISTTVTAIMLVSEGFACFIPIILWLVCMRLADVYATFTLLEEREIQFKKDRLEHFERSLKVYNFTAEALIMTNEANEKKALDQKHILNKRAKKFTRTFFHTFGLAPHLLPSFFLLQVSMLVLYFLAREVASMLDVQNQATTNFRSFGKMMYQHRAAYHMIFDAVLIKAGIGKNVTITAQLTKLNNVINNMKLFQTDMENFYRRNKDTDTGHLFSNIPMIFDPCGSVDLTVLDITSDACHRLADGTLGQDFMMVMNWAISMTENSMNNIRSINKTSALTVFTQPSFLNLEFLVKRFYMTYYKKFAASFKASMRADQDKIRTRVGALAIELSLVMIVLSILFTYFGARSAWRVASNALNSIKYIPSISLLNNAHLKLKIKKYNPKYV